MIIYAIQAMEHDKGRIAIRTGGNRLGGEVFIAAGDNSRGIAPEMADKLFDSFESDEQDQGGTGLGLAVSYNRVKAHEGNILLEGRLMPLWRTHRARKGFAPERRGKTFSRGSCTAGDRC